MELMKSTLFFPENKTKTVNTKMAAYPNQTSKLPCPQFTTILFFYYCFLFYRPMNVVRISSSSLLWEKVEARKSGLHLFEVTLKAFQNANKELFNSNSWFLDL